jgi:hypothetical protein
MVRSLFLSMCLLFFFRNCNFTSSLYQEWNFVAWSSS